MYDFLRSFERTIKIEPEMPVLNRETGEDEHGGRTQHTTGTSAVKRK